MPEQVGDRALSDMRTVEASSSHVPFLLARMGPARALAIKMRAECEPEVAILANIAHSQFTWCGIDGGGVVNMGGVQQMPCGGGYVWQFITDAVAQHKRGYIEQGRAMMARGLREFPRLLTIIETDNPAALRHCRRNGWEIGAPTEINGVLASVCERMRKPEPAACLQINHPQLFGVEHGL